MFRNQYDTDVCTWSPAGRIHQIEYAMEAVKQGSAAVGIRGKNHVVLATLKRAASELSSFQQKVFKIDDHMGIAMAGEMTTAHVNSRALGLTADGRVLSRYMRNECINHRFIYDGPFPVSRLVTQVADKSQVCTQRSWKRPYGVGLLVAGHDQSGPHLFQTCPSGNYYEYKAMAIGARSQAAKTYLERHFEQFEGCNLEEMIKHAIAAIKESCTEGDLTTSNCTVAMVGEGQTFEILEGEKLKPYLDMLEAEEGGAEGAAEGGAEAGGEAPMES